jgi:MFS family permease
VLIAGPILAALASLLTAQAHSFPELLVYRFVAGWAQQMWMLARLAIIADTGAANQRGRQITGLISMETTGRLLGPSIGGLVGAVDIRVPFVLHALISLLAITPSFKLIKETAPSRTGAARASGSAGSVRELMIFPVIMLFVAQLFASTTRGTLFQGGMNIYAAFAYDMDVRALGVIGTIAAAIGIPITLTAGFLMDRFGRKASIVPGFALLGAALATTALLDSLHSPTVAFITIYFIVHAAQSMTSGNMQTIGSDVAPAHLRGRFFGIWQLIGQIAGVISPAAFGFLAETTGYGGSFLFLAATAFAACFILVTQVKTNMADRTRASEARA